jgi:hypothetical protein
MDSDSTREPLERTPSAYNPLHSFRLPRGEGKHYQQQFGDMYFLRLAKLKPVVEAIAKEAWDGFTVRIKLTSASDKALADQRDKDSRRDCTEGGEGTGCATRTPMLGGGDSLYGHAPETEYS